MKTNSLYFCLISLFFDLIKKSSKKYKKLFFMFSSVKNFLLKWINILLELLIKFIIFCKDSICFSYKIGFKLSFSILLSKISLINCVILSMIKLYISSFLTIEIISLISIKQIWIFSLNVMKQLKNISLYYYRIRFLCWTIIYLLFLFIFILDYWFIF